MPMIYPAVSVPKLFTHLKIASAADAKVSVEEVDTFAGIMDKVGITNPSLRGKLGLGVKWGEYLAPLVHLVDAFLAVVLQGEYGRAINDGIAIEPVVHHLVVVPDGTRTLKLVAVHLPEN